MLFPHPHPFIPTCSLKASCPSMFKILFTFKNWQNLIIVLSTVLLQFDLFFFFFFLADRSPAKLTSPSVHCVAPIHIHIHSHSPFNPLCVFSFQFFYSKAWELASSLSSCLSTYLFHDEWKFNYQKKKLASK